MHFVDEIFREIKIVGWLEDIKKVPLKERWKKLAEIVSKLNILKAEMTDFTSDEQLYLSFKVQEKGVDMGLCSYFYIFFSTKNNKFHHICKVRNKQRVYCRGVDKKKCIAKALDSRGFVN